MYVLCVACLTMFVNCLVKQFTICLGVVVTSLLNVVELFSVVGVALFDRPCMVFQIWYSNVRVVPVIPMCIYVFLP